MAGESSAPADQLKPLFAASASTLTRRVKGKYLLIDNAVPTNHVIDHAGVVRYAKAAALDLDDLTAIIVPLWKEAPPS